MASQLLQQKKIYAVENRIIKTHAYKNKPSGCRQEQSKMPA